MVDKRTVFFVSLAIAIIALIVIPVVLNDTESDTEKISNDANSNIDKNFTNSENSKTKDNKSIALANKRSTKQIPKTTSTVKPTPKATKVIPQSTPQPVARVIMPTAIPRPTMRELPQISIDGPDTVAKGDKFTLEFFLDPTSEKITGFEIVSIYFDGDLIEAKVVDILNADVDSGFSTTGIIGNGVISDITTLKREGITGKFLVIEFEATGTGKVNLEAKITATNEDTALVDLVLTKSVEVQ